MAGLAHKFPWTLSRLSARFARPVLLRAEQLVSSGAVYDVGVETRHGVIRLSAAVECGQDEPLATELRAIPGQGINGVSSACTCSAGAWCKHVAALLIAYPDVADDIAAEHAAEAIAALLNRDDGEDGDAAPNGSSAQTAADDEAEDEAEDEADAVVPQPVVQLDLRQGRPGEHLGALRLAFDYGGTLVCESDHGVTVEVTDARGTRRVIRDQVAERNAQERLRKRGLTPLARARNQFPVDGNGHLWVIDTWSNDDQTSAFLQIAEKLRGEGFGVTTSDAFPLQLVDGPQRWQLDLSDRAGPDWFDLDLGIEVGGERISLLPIIERAIRAKSFPLVAQPDEPPDATWLAPIDDRRRISLPIRRLRELVLPLLELFAQPSGRERKRWRVPSVRAQALSELRSVSDLHWRGAARLREAVDRLRSLGKTPEIVSPPALQAELRSYQLAGLAWLQGLAQAGLGGVLADDMGLGKTLQLIAHLLTERDAGRLVRPALVVCPTSVLPNWQRELARFAPCLRVLILHGKDRVRERDGIAAHDLVLTSYALLPRDGELLAEIDWSVVALDEAQAIKNPDSLAGGVARQLSARQRLAMTGTPIENHLGELWSLLDFAVPGLLGDERSFARVFRQAIEKRGDAAARDRLARRVAPFILRRTKEQVAQELPGKSEMLETIVLSGRQRDLYESLRLSQHERVLQAIRQRGLTQSGMVVLDALLKLRQVCCDPRLVEDSPEVRLKDSAKLNRLIAMLTQLAAEGRRILLFSQFTSMLDLIEPELVERRIEFVRLDGSTGNRDEPVQRFQSGQVPLFLLSLRAGGVGLNLTAADTVIHYDPWWNPAVEDQATDRAHRIGQDKPVFVYKLIAQGTVEEKIQSLKTRKAELAEALLSEGASGRLELTADDVSELFRAIA